MVEYLYDQVGEVAEIYPLHKAILTFRKDGREQRALLWAKHLACDSGLPLPESQSIDTVLSVGDQLVFNCHVYDNENSQDRCGWYVVRAQSALATPELTPYTFNVKGQVDELTRRRGFVQFTVPGSGEPQRAVFVAARYFDHGRRLPADSSLVRHLQEGQMVYLDAVLYSDGRLQGAQWYAPLVWRGQRPEVELDPQPPPEVLAGEDDAPVRQTLTLSDDLFPLLSSADSRAGRRRHHSDDKWGYISSLLNAEYGVLLWQVEPRKYESVLFHRSQAHLFDLNLRDYDLRNIFKKGDHLRFEAHPSEYPEAYRWKATSVWVEA